MRESNYSFPVQNRAAVVISSQLYDRRALDSTSPLPLFNSLTHLTYLTSTSPRIREILTIDGGLERLVRLLREFCSHPPAPESPRTIYGLKPPAKRKKNSKGKLPDPTSTMDWYPAAPNVQSSSLSRSPFVQSYDRHAALRFSLAFQCVVNIGVRGSESVRARVVQAGMLDVVSSVLESWLVSKGFAVVPSATGSGAPRESKEARVARRLEMLERRTREPQRDLGALQAIELARALSVVSGRPEFSTTASQTSPSSLAQRSRRRGVSQPPSEESSSHEVANHSDDSRSSAPRPRSADDQTSGDETHTLRRRDTLRPSDITRLTVNPAPVDVHPTLTTPSSSYSSGNEYSMPSSSRRSPNATPSTSSGNVSEDTSADATPVGGNTPTGSVIVTSRERSGTVIGRPTWDADERPPAESASPVRRTRRVSASRSTTSATSRSRNQDTDDDVITEAEAEQDGNTTAHQTRMAVIIQPDGPDSSSMDMIMDQTTAGMNLQGVGIGVEQGLVNLDMQTNDDLAMGAPPGAPGAIANVPVQATPSGSNAPAQHSTPGPTISPTSVTPHQPNELTPRGPVVPLTLSSPTRAPTVPMQLLTPETATTGVAMPPTVVNNRAINQPLLSPTNPLLSRSEEVNGPYREDDVLLSLQLLAYLSKYPHVRQAFYKARTPLGPHLVASHLPQPPVSSPSSYHAPNVFSLVERFTFRPSPSELNLPRLPQEIQYWAGVIMRNACRKDETRGGIRQCANMVCGKWESFPREFAKCRRCRKAKYCGKECQSKAWADGHRFWCSSRDAEAADNNNTTNINGPPNASTDTTVTAQNGEAMQVAQNLAVTRARHHGQAERHHRNPSNPSNATTPQQQGRMVYLSPSPSNVFVRPGGPRTVRMPLSAHTPTSFPSQQTRHRITQHAIPPDTTPIGTREQLEEMRVGLVQSRRRAGTLPGTLPSAGPISQNDPQMLMGISGAVMTNHDGHGQPQESEAENTGSGASGVSDAMLLG